MFSSPTLVHTPNGAFREEIHPAAFNKLFARDGHRITILTREHVPGALLARVSSGTLELTLGSFGMDMRASLPDSELGRETAELVRRGDLDSMSFAFGLRDADSEWFDGRDGIPTRVIKEIPLLLDVSVVAFPAYAGTRVALGGDGGSLPGGFRSSASRAALRRHAALKFKQSLERRGKPIECPPRLRAWIKLRNRRVVRVTPLSVKGMVP